MTTVPAEQYRIEQVQVLNWGGFGGLQVMQAGRASTAILGPSGRGKSTLLDGIASVVMPNPQEFNQAARDDKRGKRERTVYTYSRGLTVSHQDDNGRSATPSYLRPPGGPGFVSGTAVTWSNGTGKRVTAFRLAWVGTDATDNASVASSTVYGFVHDTFDLSRLNGLKPARPGAAPVSGTPYLASRSATKARCSAGIWARRLAMRLSGSPAANFSGTSRSTPYGLPPVWFSIQVSCASSSPGV